LNNEIATPPLREARNDRDLGCHMEERKSAEFTVIAGKGKGFGLKRKTRDQGELTPKNLYP